MTPGVCWMEGWAWSVEKLEAGSRGSPLELARLMYSFITHTFTEHLLCAWPGSKYWEHSSDQDGQNSSPPGADIQGNNNPNRMKQVVMEAVPFLGSALPCLLVCFDEK